MMTGRVLREIHGGLCTLTLNRPEKLNALDTLAFDDLDLLCAELEDQTATIGCVILRGAGRAFCAGADLTAIGRAPIDPLYKPGVIDRFARLPQPVIAAVHGICFTGGLELALAADFIVADTDARFADTHGKWGLVSAWGMSQRLPRRIGAARAKWMMLTGTELSGNQAVAFGLADAVSEPGMATREAEALSAKVLANSWHSNFATKRVLHDTDGLSLEDGLAYERQNYRGAAPDYLERIRRFRA